MKILVAGATGNTGLRLMKKLVARSHDPVALLRESSDTDKLPVGCEQRHGDLADLPDDICEGCDAVVFAAGSGAGTSAEMTDRIDRDGAMRLIDLAV
jgi:nucleoside-diphosphate-sugar epimerase